MPNIFVGAITASAPGNTLCLTTTDALVAANNDRVGLVITNLSQGTIYLGLSGREAVLNKGIALSPNGGVWTMDDYTYNREKVQGIAHTTNSVVAIQEFTQYGG